MSRDDREFFVNQLTRRKGFITKEDFILSALLVDFSNNRKIIREIFDYLDSVRSVLSPIGWEWESEPIGALLYLQER